MHLDLLLFLNTCYRHVICRQKSLTYPKYLALIPYEKFDCQDFMRRFIPIVPENYPKDVWRHISFFLDGCDSNRLRLCCKFLHETMPSKTMIFDLPNEIVRYIGDFLVDTDIDAYGALRRSNQFFKHILPYKIMVYAVIYNGWYITSPESGVGGKVWAS